MAGVVEEWFGGQFAALHPLLQRLHREGGVLCGEVNVSFGQRIAGVLGRRIAVRLGVPSTAGVHLLEVEIFSDEGALHWNRRFNGASTFFSRFVPVGTYPSGYWVEQSGPLRLFLGVKVVRGGWHWEHRGTRFLSVPIPGRILPRAFASKEVEGQLYRFSVEVRAPLLGKLLCYRGQLTNGGAKTHAPERSRSAL
jgi:hypothetical protein